MTKPMWIWMPVVLLAVAAACSSDASPEAPPACDAPVTATSITMGEFFYEPACLEASNGDTVQVVNEGDAPHTYTVEDANLANLEPHDTGEMTIQGLTAGTVYEVTCIYHPNMTAALKVI